MKKIFLSLMLLTGAACALVSCTNEERDPVATVVENIVLSTPAGADYILTAPTAGEDVVTVKWSSADFGYSASVTYLLEVVKKTADFSDPQSFVLGNYNENTDSNHEKSLTQRQLNSMLLGVGGGIGTSESYKMRVVGVPSTQLASSSNGLKSISQEVDFTGNPFDTFDEFDRIYVPGNYGSTSTYGFWDPANAARLFSANNNGKYEGFVWMNVANPDFKFAPGPAWGGDKGENGSTGAFTGVLGTAHNINPTGGAGTYFFTVDWIAGTYTMAKRRIAVIGDATGWNPNDLVFNTDPASPYYRMYTKNLALATGGTLLIRLEDDWSVKMGTASGNAEAINVTAQNKIKLGGGDMKVPSNGNFTVVLDLNNSANYNIRLIPN